MSDLYTRLTSLCEEKNISPYRMCKDTGMQPSLFTDLKAGRQHGISAKKASVIAAYFGVSEEFLLYGRENKKTATESDGLDIDYSYASEEQKELIQEILKLSPERVSALLSLAKTL